MDPGAAPEPRAPCWEATDSLRGVTVSEWAVPKTETAMHWLASQAGSRRLDGAPGGLSGRRGGVGGCEGWGGPLGDLCHLAAPWGGDEMRWSHRCPHVWNIVKVSPWMQGRSTQHGEVPSQDPHLIQQGPLLCFGPWPSNILSTPLSGISLTNNLISFFCLTAVGPQTEHWRDSVFNTYSIKLYLTRLPSIDPIKNKTFSSVTVYKTYGGEKNQVSS